MVGERPVMLSYITVENQLPLLKNQILIFLVFNTVLMHIYNVIFCKMIECPQAPQKYDRLIPKLAIVVLGVHYEPLNSN